MTSASTERRRTGIRTGQSQPAAAAKLRESSAQAAQVQPQAQAQAKAPCASAEKKPGPRREQKKVDDRVRTVLQNGVLSNQRSFFVIVGDRAKEQVVNLYLFLTKARGARRPPNVLWCYKKDLGFTSNRRKREREIRRRIERGQRNVARRVEGSADTPAAAAAAAAADTDEIRDPFEVFISHADINYVYYRESHRILGNTYGMCVLQDFEALTPNLLARSVETVEGGGVVLLFLKSMTSLRQLYTMAMDVHSRFRTEAHQDVVARFNERFLLSLTSCPTCLVVDDELNVLPISAAREIIPVSSAKSEETTRAIAFGTALADPELVELDKLKKALLEQQMTTKSAPLVKQNSAANDSSESADIPVLGAVVQRCVTLDQARALVSFVDAIASDSQRATVSLTAARGRGKSAALGLALAAAVAYGYSNIFVTSPAPENLKTLFDFVLKGLDALGYEEHTHYTIFQANLAAASGTTSSSAVTSGAAALAAAAAAAAQSTEGDNNKHAKRKNTHHVVRINIFKHHRQTIQYILPQDASMLSQAELLVIDEAAAIPLPLVRKLLGPYLVFLASTIHGYEGTGRSLSLKLFAELRAQNRAAVQSTNDADSQPQAASTALSWSSFRELTLEAPIRYARSDPLESWLNRLLCLDATVSRSVVTGMPHPSQCQLYYVSRDTLFSYHPIAELFLQRMMALYVASHYKNSPNDLQLMSDAPAHHLFALLPPQPSAPGVVVPEPLVVLQVCLEGQISNKSVRTALSQGLRADGDLIPWCMSQQFPGSEFASLSGVRVVRVATHPDYMSMGYGSRALQLLEEYYSGIFDLGPTAAEKQAENSGSAVLHAARSANVVQSSAGQATSTFDFRSKLAKEKDIGLRNVSDLPPLLLRLSLRPPEKLDWLGVSYGLTSSLLKFWKRAGLFPAYLRQTANELTGEYTCIMLKQLRGSTAPNNWVAFFAKEFANRLSYLLGSSFTKFPCATGLSLFEYARKVKNTKGKQNQDENADADADASADEELVALGPQMQKDESCVYLTSKQINDWLTPHDLKRLEAYASHLTDYHVISDLVPKIARMYFASAIQGPPDAEEKAGAASLQLTGLEEALLLGIGLQNQKFDDLNREFGLRGAQIMALFLKSMRKFSASFTRAVSAPTFSQVA